MEKTCICIVYILALILVIISMRYKETYVGKIIFD